MRPALLFACFACGCAAGSGGELRTPEYRPEGQTKALVAKSSLRPLILEWPASDRASLEGLRGKGVVVVRYGQGEMELLPRCRATAGYRFTTVSPKVDSLVIRNGEELKASMPLHSAKLEGRLAKRDQLEVKMTIAGIYESEPRTWRAVDLSGDCSRATHVITSLTVGAFDIVAFASTAASGGVSVLGASAGSSREAARETVSRDGDHAACIRGGSGGNAPNGCGALLRVDLQPIEIPARRGTCAPTDLDCLATLAQGGCPAGFARNGDACEAVNPERPSLIEGLSR
jgi:hypothetical protein